MQRKRNITSVRLRILVFKKGHKFESICLDTNIANRANSRESLEKKIIDSTILYLRSFSEEEIKNRAYIRKASFGYHVLWFVQPLAKLIIRKYRPNKVEFDTSSGKLSFA
jgi:hypothetical protein